MEYLLPLDERVNKYSAVAVSNLGDSSVDFVMLPWVNAANYWGVKFDFTKAGKKKFDEECINPQSDVHMFQEIAS